MKHCLWTGHVPPRLRASLGLLLHTGRVTTGDRPRLRAARPPSVLCAPTRWACGLGAGVPRVPTWGINTDPTAPTLVVSLSRPGSSHPETHGLPAVGSRTSGPARCSQVSGVSSPSEGLSSSALALKDSVGTGLPAQCGPRPQGWAHRGLQPQRGQLRHPQGPFQA